MPDDTPSTRRRPSLAPRSPLRMTGLHGGLLLAGIVLAGCGDPPQAPPPLEEQGRVDLRTVDSAPQALVAAP